MVRRAGDRVPEARQHVQPRDRASRSPCRPPSPCRCSTSRSSTAWSRSTVDGGARRDDHAGDPRPARRRRRQGDPPRHRPHRVERRGARRDGPERRRQEHAVGGRDGQARLRGARRHGHARRRRRARRCRRGSGPPPASTSCMQYPTEVPGVALDDMLREALAARGATLDGPRRRCSPTRRQRIGLEERLLHRPLNVDLSGGEKKRNETLQLAVLRPRIAILDELDSGLDIDALRACARRIEAATQPIRRRAGARRAGDHPLQPAAHRAAPRRVHILVRGRIVAEGGPELADQLEADGYAAFTGEPDDGAADATGRSSGPARSTSCSPTRGTSIRVFAPSECGAGRPRRKRSDDVRHSDGHSVRHGDDDVWTSATGRCAGTSSSPTSPPPSRS